MEANKSNVMFTGYDSRYMETVDSIDENFGGWAYASPQ